VHSSEVHIFAHFCRNSETPNCLGFSKSPGALHVMPPRSAFGTQNACESAGGSARPQLLGCARFSHTLNQKRDGYDKI
jgi:hypothetical protein